MRVAVAQAASVWLDPAATTDSLSQPKEASVNKRNVILLPGGVAPAKAAYAPLMARPAERAGGLGLSPAHRRRVPG